MAKKKFSVKKPIATPPPSPIQCFVQDTVSLATLRRERGGRRLVNSFPSTGHISPLLLQMTVTCLSSLKFFIGCRFLSSVMRRDKITS